MHIEKFTVCGRSYLRLVDLDYLSFHVSCLLFLVDDVYYTKTTSRNMSGADKMSVDIEVNEDGETLLLKAARIVTSLPVENSKIAFPSKPACVFRLRAS